MPNFLHIAKQAIYEKDNHIFGYELYYRNQDEDMTFSDKRLATASVLVNTLNQVGLHALIGSAKAFINIDAKILLTDIIDTIPKEHFVLELHEDIQITQKESECIKALHHEGYSFALDNINLDEENIKNITPLLPHIDYIKFDTTALDLEGLDQKLSLFHGKKLIAQKIESSFVYKAYQDLGFHYFQGFYLSHPELIKKNRIDPHHLGVIRLFNLLQGAVSMEDISTEFEQHNEIVLQLLQFINSGGFNFESTPKNIGDILETIGKKPLMQWLMLIVYAKSGHTDGQDINPHSILVQNRIDLMLGLLQRLHEKEDKDLMMQARFVALLSLLETIFEMPLEPILAELNVEEVIKNALIDHEGELGRLYTLVLAIEKSDQEKAEKLLLAYGLKIESIWSILEEHLGHPRKIIH